MLVEKNVSLQSYNTFGIAQRANRLVRIRTEADLVEVAAQLQQPAAFGAKEPDAVMAPLVLGGGSNIVLTGDVRQLVLKMEISGMQVLEDTPHGVLLEAGAGERWHDFVAWGIAQGFAGLENLALIPGTVGAAPVQNIGAYGVELQDRFHSLDAIDLWTGKRFSLNAEQCAFGYRDSIFKHAPAGVKPQPLSGTTALSPAAQSLTSPTAKGMGLAGRAVISRVRFWLPKPWQPLLEYADLARRIQETGITAPSAAQVFDWVVEIRRSKLPDPAEIGNAGSFFKNPTVSQDQCEDIIAREPRIVHYPMPDGSVKLAAGWLIDACGWKGKMVGNAAVYSKQALVLINAGHGESSATGGEVMTLARAIQTSVYERYGIHLEPEPVVI